MDKKVDWKKDLVTYFAEPLTSSADARTYNQQRQIFKIDDCRVAITIPMEAKYFVNYEDMIQWSIAVEGKEPDPILTPEGYFALIEQLEKPTVESNSDTWEEITTKEEW